MKQWLALILLLVAAGRIQAEERILNYDVDVSINTNGSLDVTERITVQVEGRQIRRGIYRDFPTRYRDRYGNRVLVDLEVVGVERDGQPEPWFTENLSNGVRINTGNDDFLPAPAEHTFTLHYRTTRQLGFFDDHDELYWNAIGSGWAFPIEAAGVAVRLPAAVPIEDMGAEGYTGRQGSKGQDYRTELPQPGVARWEMTRALAPYEAFTIVLSFPKGIVAAPSAGQRAAWFFGDNGGVLIAVLGFAGLIWFCLYEWRRVGRDPPKGIIIARYNPPSGQTPAALRFVRRMGYDMRCFSAEVLSLAVAGRLSIDRERKFLKDEWRLDRESAAAQAQLADSQQTLLDRIFPQGRRQLVLKNTNASVVAAAQAAHRRSLDKALQPRYFKRNGPSVLKAFAIAAVGIAAAAVFSGGAGIIAIVVVAVLMIAAIVVFTFLVRAPTQEGRALLDEIEGLKLYMSVAERDELARMQGPETPPELDAKRYETLLPYAVALEVENAWTEKFTLAVGAAAAAATASSMHWYRGGNVGDLGSFASSIGSGLSSQIASAASPPGSSSGSGGGGSAGGGGGGGGGGGR